MDENIYKEYTDLLQRAEQDLGKGPIFVDGQQVRLKPLEKKRLDELTTKYNLPNLTEITWKHLESLNYRCPTCQKVIDSLKKWSRKTNSCKSCVQRNIHVATIDPKAFQSLFQRTKQPKKVTTIPKVFEKYFAQGISQANLARIIGVSQPYICKIAKGHTISYEMAQCFDEVFDEECYKVEWELRFIISGTALKNMISRAGLKIQAAAREMGWPRIKLNRIVQRGKHNISIEDKESLTKLFTKKFTE